MSKIFSKYSEQINGYIFTSNGIELDYKYIDTDNVSVSNRRKYSKDQMDIIKDIHNKIKVLIEYFLAFLLLITAILIVLDK